MAPETGILHAGYRAPIAAVMFVAESTSGDSYVVPALIAGNAVLLKAASQTLLAGERFAAAFEQAGLPEDWQPTSWEELLDAARAIKENVPDVVPLNIFAGNASGEATTLQGYLMLLLGTSMVLLVDGQPRYRKEPL